MPKNRVLQFVVVVVVAFALVAGFSSSATAKAQKGQTASAQLIQLKKTKLTLHKSKSVVRFWNHKGRWALFSRTEKCSELPSVKHERICKMARRSLQFHAKNLKVVEKKLERLKAPRDTGYLLPSQARELGKKMAELKGWSGEQWECLDSLWGSHESGWRVTADNPTSSAYGIPQALPGSKMGEGWQNSAYVQIRWGLSYVAGRYGTPCSALSSRKAKGWY